MIRDESEINYISYNLELKSRSKKGKKTEALSRLKSLYPYGITERNIRIKESERKGVFCILINPDGFEDKKGFKKLLVCLGIFIALTSVCLLLFQKTLKDRAAEKAEQKLIEEENKRKVEALKELQKKAQEVEWLWSGIESQSYEKVFSRIQVLYLLLPKGTVIESLGIEKDSFSLEVSIGDSTKVLSNLEGSKRLSAIKMSRSFTSGGRETASISGNFVSEKIRAGESESYENKVSFYENLIEKSNERNSLMAGKNISDYIKEIRICLHKNGCLEQYVQVKGEKENLDVEIFIKSKATSILNFLSDIQSGEENLFDIKSFHFRNSENQTELQSLIVFKSGIGLKENEEWEDVSAEIKDVSPDEISAVLWKKKLQKAVPVKPVTEGKKETVIEKPLQRLSYVGLSATGGKSFVIAKDEDMNVIYKLFLTESEADGDFCLQEGSLGYRARIRGEWYEVRK